MSTTKTADRSAHLGLQTDQRYPDPLMAWPRDDIRAMLQGFARWSVKHRVEIFDLYTMCCASTDEKTKVRWPFLLYASTKPFFFEGRLAHHNELVGTILQNPLTVAAAKKPRLLSTVGALIVPPGVASKTLN